MHPDSLALLTAPVVKLAYNWRLLIGIGAGSVRAVLAHGLPALTGAEYLEVASLGLMLAGVPLSALALRRKPRDPFLLGGLGATCVLLLAILGLYFVPSFQAVRILLIGVPFECAACALLWADLSHSPRKLRYVLTGLGMAFGIALTVAALRPTDAERVQSQHDVEFLQSIRHDNRLVLVTPVELPFEYLYAHYPVRWSFVPLDQRTFHLLNETTPVGTVVLESSTTETRLTAAELAAEGFNLVETTLLDGHEYVVYQR